MSEDDTVILTDEDRKKILEQGESESKQDSDKEDDQE